MQGERSTRFARISRPLVTLENLPSRAGASTDALSRLEDMERIIEALPNLHLTLDVGHCLQNGEDPCAFIERHHARIANIHLHDGETGGSAHRALGTGELALDSLLGVLGEVGYEGFITVETLSFDDLRISLDVLETAGVMCRAHPPHDR